MNNYLIFRTDRIGDFLLTAILIKSIKRNDPDCYISLVSSEKNFEYINSFENIDKVFFLKRGFINKLFLFFSLNKHSYNSIIVHDNKNRSKFISFFLKYKKKVICNTNLIDTQIEIIKKTCKKINLKFYDSCLDFLDNRNYSLYKLPFNSYIHLHFDEKWIYENYIKKYVNIEPNKDELLSFINNIIQKNNNLIITTGKKMSNLLNEIKSEVSSERIKIFDNQELLELENIVFNSILLISCHGWITHIASARKIKQIDIIDNSYPYIKWTSHLRNYNSLSRKPFKFLSKEIINLI